MAGLGNQSLTAMAVVGFLVWFSKAGVFESGVRRVAESEFEVVDEGEEEGNIVEGVEEVEDDQGKF